MGRMGMQDAETTIERFRAAAIGMEPWEEVLATVATATGSRAAQLAVFDTSGGLAVNLSFGISREEEALYYQHGGADLAHNIRNADLLRANPMTCRTEEDFATPDMMASAPIYRDLFVPYDFLHCCMARLHGYGEPPAAFAVHRTRSMGHAGTRERRFIEGLAPAIAGATRVAVHLARDRETAILSTAEELAGPTILLGTGLRIVSLSPSAEAMLRDGANLSIRSGRLVATCAASHVALERAFAAAATPGGTGRLNPTVRLRGIDSTIQTAEMAPLPHHPAGRLALAKAMLMLRPIATARVRDARSAYGLTTAEAEVATLLVEGLDIATIARHRGTAITTVRSQVKMLLAKTDSHRQAELVLKLHGG